MRIPTRPLNFSLLLLASGIVVLTLYVTHRQAKRLGDEEKNKIRLWTEATRRAVDLNSPTQDYEFILQVIERNETVPVLLTNSSQHPISMRNIPESAIGDQKKVKQLIETFAEENQPIRIVFPSGDVNYVYYGRSETLKELRYYPFIQLSLIVVLVLLGYLVLHYSRRTEQNSVWVGMARETAHQLGTPISSLVAWQELLSSNETDLIDSQVLAESLGLDVMRLQRVAERFSKIGAKPQLLDTDLQDTIATSVEYMRGRISQRIVLNFHLVNTPHPIYHNAILLQWVVENLIRNAVDAMSQGGTIELSLVYTSRGAQIDCTDTGCGISKRKWKSIFRPGYSTKTRGWGLGLSLSRRIIVSYHKGKLFVHNSIPLRGTTFRILLRG